MPNNKSSIIIKPFNFLTLNELFEIVRARFDVFVCEQKILEPEYDDIDYRSIHIFIHEENHVIAYARLFQGDKEDVWCIGRMLTTRRKQGLGALIIEAAVETAKNYGATSITLHAQIQAIGFYQKQGFKPSSPIFQEAGIPHREMIRKLT